MRLLIEIYDAAGNRLGDGPITTAVAASVTRNLDAPGDISFRVPFSDDRAFEYIKEERRVRILLEQYGVMRELARGIVRSITNTRGDGWMLEVSGPDALDELKRRSTLIGREFDDEEVQQIASDLITLVPGWTSSSTEDSKLTARFDAVSVLKALQKVVELQGVHLRLADGNEIEVGTFGDDAGVIFINTDQISPTAYRNENVAIITDVLETIESENAFNRLYLLGAGENVDSALTLERSTRTTPYTIESTVFNGRTIYYIEDTASITEYGLIERFVQLQEIAPLSNTESDEERAANAVYDAGVAVLQRHKNPQVSYRVIAICSQIIRPGDKVRMIWKDRLRRDDGSLSPMRNIDDEFWVLSVTEDVVNDRVIMMLELSNIDKYRQSMAKILIGSIEQLRLNNIVVQPSYNHYLAGPEQLQIDPTNSGQVELEVTNATFSIDRVLMRVRTQRFVSTTTAALATPSLHEHLIMRSNDGTAAGSMATQRFTIVEQSTGTLFHFDAVSDVGSGTRFFSMQPSGSHTHNLAYGIFKDTERPANMTITVNGDVVASGIGSTGSDLDTTIDITDEIRNKAGGFRSTHIVGVSCSAGKGEVIVTFDVYETIVPFKLN